MALCKIWRRGLNGDYECGLQELAPLTRLKHNYSYERTVFDGVSLDDLDNDVIEQYRKLRAKVRPNAEELKGSNEEMLLAMNLLEKTHYGLLPNAAALLLFGKTLSLRRFMPAVRVDYVRTSGTEWVEDPHNRFETTLDIREPLLRLIPKAEAAILDELPRHFRLNDGDLQRSDEPLLPYKVVREAIVNMVMHRDYSIHQPSIIVRYRNRIETLNAGYSLKSTDLLGEVGSALRNPIIANVLYDIEYAEVKGTGIRTMRRMLKESGLAAPVFINYVVEEQFKSIYLLHQLMGEEQLAWLSHFSSLNLSSDEAKALVLAKETGAVDNAAIRSISNLDRYEASQLLRRLHHQVGILTKGGAGSATYYQLNETMLKTLISGQNGNKNLTIEDNSNLDNNDTDLAISEEIMAMIEGLSLRPKKEKLWPVILRVCQFKPMSSNSLASLFNRREDHFKTNHLSKMRNDGLLEYLYPEVINHPEQAYVATQLGIEWANKHINV